MEPNNTENALNKETNIMEYYHLTTTLSVFAFYYHERILLAITTTKPKKLLPNAVSMVLFLNNVDAFCVV
mgnify:CR=1 FL=1